MKFFTLLVLFFFGSLAGLTQLHKTSSYRHFTTSDGLPSTQVQGLFEDSRGYIWIITDRGASVYNGYEFKTYTAKDGLPTNSVLLINEDRKGRMWFMCNNGAYCFLDGDTIRNYAGNDKISALLKDKLAGPFYFDEKDTMWVSTFSGIQLFKCAGDSVSEYLPNEKGTNESSTYYLRKVGEKLVTLLIGDVVAENKLTTSDNISYLLGVAGDCKLACSVQVADNRWALAGPGGFVVFDVTGDVQAYFNSSPFVFSSMDHDRSGNLWLTNSNGAYRLRDYMKDPKEADVYFEGHFITAIVQDRSGNYWMGDRDNGVYFIPSLEMELYKAVDSGKQNKIVSVKKYGSEIYYADASGGIFHLENEVALPCLKSGVPSDVTLDFVQTFSGDYIVGNNPFLYLNKGASLKPLNSECVIRKSLNLSDGRCVYALADGIAFTDVKNNWLRIPKEIFKERCNALLQEENGMLWIGSNNGLFMWKDSLAIPIQQVNDLKPRIVDMEFWNGYMVLATRNMGLLFYKNGEIIQLKESDGLLSDITDCIAVADNNEIWLGQAGGLQRLTIMDVTKKAVEYFRVNDQKGLPSNEINDLLLDNGKLFVATNNGLVVMDVAAKSLIALPSIVKLESVETGNESLNFSTSMDLKFDQNNLQFHFLSLNFRTGEKTKYRYRLIGLHDDWQQTINRNVDYWSLPAGKYSFEVCGMNEDGIWGEPAFVSFEIHPHFTKTMWFRLSIFVFSLATLLGAFFIFYRNKKRQFENKSKMLELRQQALNANMNPHFIFNSLNSIQHFINTNKAREANEYLADFSRLIRMNLETNRHSTVTLEDELERLDLYLKLEKLRFGERLFYQIDIHENTNIYDFEIPPMLLQPYAENALLHGILPSDSNGEIRLNIYRSNQSYVVEIIDNGVGIKKSREKKKEHHESLALRMNEERLAILQRQFGGVYSISITDRSDLDQLLHGTIVRIVLPVD